MTHKTYARVLDNFAIEIYIPPDGYVIEECFPPATVALFEEVPEGTLQNATRDPLTGIWTNPEPE
jgi:hypothetical protein